MGKRIWWRTNLGNEIEFLAIDRRIAFFECKGNEIESEIPSTEVRDVETSLRVCGATDLDRGRCSGSCSVKGRTYLPIHR